jgi:DNA (cytosine-5)-methyltransferase 1
LENVRGHLSLGFKEVLGDLAENGYDAKWRIVRASDIGAPHQRARLFIIAYSNSEGSQRTWHKANDLTDGFVTNTDCDACQESRRTDREISATNRGLQSRQDIGQARSEHRFSRSMEREAIPNALDQGKLNAKFVEYIMGLPGGWVTDLNLSRTQQLKMLGNGVVPQQAYYALELLHD